MPPISNQYDNNDIAPLMVKRGKKTMAAKKKIKPGTILYVCKTYFMYVYLCFISSVGAEYIVSCGAGIVGGCKLPSVVVGH